MKDHLDIEEDFHTYEHKESRKERKIAQALDKSKYKKTNQKKKSAPNTDNLETGRVLSIISNEIIVDIEGTKVVCTLRGVHKKEKTRQKSLIAIGDIVHIDRSSKEQGVIVHIAERYSVLSRADNLRRRFEQIIAANIDQVLITTSALFPTFKPTLIDRYLIMTERGNMQPIILINKCDVLEDPPSFIQTEEVEEAKALIEESLETYRALNIPILRLSAKSGEGLDELRALMRNKTSVFSGQSGVGKSSLINQMLGTDFKIGDIVPTTRKGSHTTTRAHLVPLESGGFCIDTPGIKSFGVWDIQKEEVQAYFPEILACSGECKFSGCTHTHEPDCAVKEALDQGVISPLRYSSYLNLLEDLSNN
ncbi:MAG: ribosome small subunit-dependent GTPase A [Simkaniaceae bacterium]|nr:ribosome small subunit-dependent GTPase A [Simkaniaceae bacterium]